CRPRRWVRRSRKVRGGRLASWRGCSFLEQRGPFDDHDQRLRRRHHIWLILYGSSWLHAPAQLVEEVFEKEHMVPRYPLIPSLDRHERNDTFAVRREIEAA